MEAQLLRAGDGRPEPIPHQSSPQSPGGAKLRDLFQKVVVGCEKERETLPHGMDIEPSVDRRLHVGDRVGEREGDFLHRRGARLANVVPADGDRVPAGQLSRAVREDVGDDPEGRLRGVDVGPARHVFLEDVVLGRA